MDAVVSGCGAWVRPLVAADVERENSEKKVVLFGERPLK
jgi:hypothetical protein